MIRTILLVAFVCSTFAASAIAQGYSGMEKRSVKSLSASDIKQLESGKGWGFALPAELNSYPGPAHILELKSQLSLTRQQAGGIERLFRLVKERAIPLGKEYVRLERKLDVAFAEKTIDKKVLEQLLNKIGSVRARLRFVHLEAHLNARKLLSKDQIVKYDKLRGYSVKTDPCENVPKGHDPELWRMHNNCKTR